MCVSAALWLGGWFVCLAGDFALCWRYVLVVLYALFAAFCGYIPSYKFVCVLGGYLWISGVLAVCRCVAGGLLVVTVGLLFLVCDFGRFVLAWWVYGW